jgi:hypothetical protein
MGRDYECLILIIYRIICVSMLSYIFYLEICLARYFTYPFCKEKYEYYLKLKK